MIIQFLPNVTYLAQSSLSWSRCNKEAIGPIDQLSEEARNKQYQIILIEPDKKIFMSVLQPGCSVQISLLWHCELGQSLSYGTCYKCEINRSSTDSWINSCAILLSESCFSIAAYPFDESFIKTSVGKNLSLNSS